MSDARSMGDESGSDGAFAEVRHIPADGLRGEGDETVFGESGDGVDFENPGAESGIESEVHSNESVRADGRSGLTRDFTDAIDD